MNFAFCIIQNGMIFVVKIAFVVIIQIKFIRK